MNILMVLDHEFPADIRVEKEINTLINDGHNVSLACLTQKKRKAIEYINKLTIFRKEISDFLLKTSVGALKFPFYLNFLAIFLSDILQPCKYDAIHIHDLPLAKVGFELSRKFQIKFILDLHENWPVLLELSPHTKSLLGRFLSSNKQWLKYENKYASLADALVVVANEMKNRLIAKGLINNNIYVVPNTSELNTFDQINDFKPDTDYITLFYSGGINKHRGIEIIVEGLSQTELPDNFRFWIVGSGSNEPFIKTMVSNLKLNKHIKFWGWKSQTEVFQLLLESDIAIIPHLKTEHSDNTSPNKIFHYMLAKKPVLASNCNYIQNIVEGYNCGLIYENNSSQDFIQKLTFMIEDSKKREEWGEHGYQAVHKNLNWENTSKSLINLYNNFEK